MIEESKINWVILAGGKATRMGGEDKGLINLNGQPLIEIICGKLKPQVSALMINANRNLERYAKYAPTLSDHITGFVGPLAGVHSALKQSDAYDWVGVVPCDSPNIPSDYVTRFIQQGSDDAEILVAYDGEHVQPVFALYHCSILPKLEAFLENGDRKIKLLLSQCKTQTIDFSHYPEMFINLNTPADLNRHERS